MIATIKASNPQHFQFRALLSGLLCDEVSPGVFEVTYRDKHKVLGLIAEAGGDVISNVNNRLMSNSERFSSF